MLHWRMNNGIGDMLHNTQVIIPNYRDSWQKNTQFMKQSLNPYNFRGFVCERSIFRFNTIAKH